jgi:hypothetical protein
MPKQVTFADRLQHATAHAGDKNPDALAALRGVLAETYDAFDAAFPEGFDRDLAEVEDAILQLGTRAASMIQGGPPSKVLGGAVAGDGV